MKVIKIRVDDNMPVADYGHGVSANKKAVYIPHESKGFAVTR